MIAGQAVLITGFSGSGKSDLALRLIDRGATLISDDYTLLMRAEHRLTASAPTNIKGKIEVRGIGIIDMINVDDVRVALVIALGDRMERLPEGDQAQNIAGISVPVINLAAFEASTPHKIELALRLKGHQ